MSITITRRTGLLSGLQPVTVRLNKKIAREIAHKETITLDLPSPSSTLSINWINFPKMTVQDGDQIEIRISLIWICLFIFLIISLFPTFLTSPADYWSSNYYSLRIAWYCFLLIVNFMPRFRLVKLSK